MVPLLLEETSLHWTGHMFVAVPRSQGELLQNSRPLRNCGIHGWFGAADRNQKGKKMDIKFRMTSVTTCETGEKDGPRWSKWVAVRDVQASRSFLWDLGKMWLTKGRKSSFRVALAKLCHSEEFSKKPSADGNGKLRETHLQTAHGCSIARFYHHENHGFRTVPLFRCPRNHQVIAFNCLRTQHKSAQMQPSCTPQGSTRIHPGYPKIIQNWSCLMGKQWFWGGPDHQKHHCVIRNWINWCDRSSFTGSLLGKFGILVASIIACQSWLSSDSLAIHSTCVVLHHLIKVHYSLQYEIMKYIADHCGVLMHFA